MHHSTPNQLEFEIARDLVTLMRAMKRDEKLAIEIKCTGNYFDWKCDGNNLPCGPSEASRAMREAYDSVFNPHESSE